MISECVSEMIIGLLSQSDNFRGLMERGNVSLAESCVLRREGEDGIPCGSKTERAECCGR